MTFSSELTRMIFHSLPTDTQLQFSRLESALTAQEMLMHIESVMGDGTKLELVARITGPFNNLGASAHADGP